MFKFTLNGVIFLLMLFFPFGLGALTALYGLANMREENAVATINKFRD